jgi:hypothetical protein
MDDEAKLAGCGKSKEKVEEVEALLKSLNCPSIDI